jgi:hypothetical protein
MGPWRRPTILLIPAAIAAVALTVTGCGLRDDSPAPTTAAAAPTDDPPVRAPASLCERVPHRIVEGAAGRQLDPGVPAERDDDPECTWRRPGGEVLVTLRLHDRVSPARFEELREDGDEEIPDLGERAYWSPFISRVLVLTEEGIFSATVLNTSVSESQVKDGGITLVRTAIETTEVPDTTTTTMTAPPLPSTGLCARISIDTVEQLAEAPLERGAPSTDWPDPERSCVIREKGEGVVLRLALHDTRDIELDGRPGFEGTEVQGVPARISTESRMLYLESDEGVLAITVQIYELTEDEFRAGVTALAEQFLRSG